MCNVPIAPHITSQLLKFPLLRPWGEGGGAAVDSSSEQQRHLWLMRWWLTSIWYNFTSIDNVTHYIQSTTVANSSTQFCQLDIVTWSVSDVNTYVRLPISKITTMTLVLSWYPSQRCGWVVCSQNEVLHGSSVVKRNIVYDAGLLICPATISQTAAGIIETFKFSSSLFSRSRSWAAGAKQRPGNKFINLCPGPGSGPAQ